MIDDRPSRLHQSLANRVSGRLSIGERFYNLLSGPGCSRMIRHVEVQHLVPMMFPHDEHEQHFILIVGTVKKVHGHRLTEVIVQEGFPGLSGRTAEGPEDA